MPDVEEVKPIPSGFLCRRCKHCGDHLRPDGLVDCKITPIPVAPVERKEYTRFEYCPQRTGFTPIPPHKLPLLASFARRLRRRGGSETESRLESAYAVVRNDMLIMTRLK